MPFRKNKVIIASAGSRKTTCLTEAALDAGDKRVLITTYTNENVEQIRDYLVQRKGHIPANISVVSWYSFLLAEGVRPYQNFVADGTRMGRIIFEDLPDAARFAKKSDPKYFLAGHNSIYRDRVAEFVCECDKQSDGRVIKRIGKIYDYILIDEMQDLAGYDLEFLEILFRSSIQVFAVGDPRQATFSTNNSRKNSGFKKGAILDWRKIRHGKLLTLEERVECYRSNQIICDFADALFPNFPKTKACNEIQTHHDGIFAIERHEVHKYVSEHKPVILRYNRRSDTMNLPAFNIGIMKGRTFDRVLIFATAGMRAYLKSKDPSKAGDLQKLYVAVTRAKYSVTFVQ